MKNLNLRLIIQLSMFGLAMGIATVFVIPSRIEPLFWLAIFGVCAVIVAQRASSHFFLHGLLISIVNSFWITSAHVLLFSAYAQKHADELSMMQNSPMANHPRMMMLITGPIVGVVSGLVLGLFCFIASKFIKRAAPPASPAKPT